MAKASTISRSLFHWLDVKTLLGAALIAELLTWLLLRSGIKLQSTEKQRRAAAALEQIGAGLSYAGDQQPGLLTLLGRKHFQEPIGIGFSGALRESDLANIEAPTGLEFLTLLDCPPPPPTRSESLR